MWKDREKSIPIIFRRTFQNRYSIPVLAGALEKKLPQVQVYLLDKIEYLQDFKKIYPIPIVCFSFMTPDLGNIIREVQLIRSAYKDNIILISGGPHPSADPEGCLNLGFDAVFVGESERTLPLYLSHLLKDRNIVKEKRIIEDDNLGDLLEEFLPYSKTLGIGAPLELTRGCFFGCSFCQTREIFKREVRHRSIASIREGVRNFIRHGRKKIFFISPNGLSYGARARGDLNLNLMRALFGEVRDEGIQFIDVGYFPSEVRPDYVTPESLELIRDYCSNKKIALGIQTGSDSLLKRIGRGHTVSQALSAASLVHKFGFMPHCDFIFGFPYETKEEMRESIKLMIELIKKFGARIHAHYYLPLPGTPLWKSASNPTPLPESIRKKLLMMKDWGQLNGWWERQEKLTESILQWKKKGYITV